MATTSTPTTPQTLLQAINELLREVRISAVMSLQAAENDKDASGAKKALDDAALEVLARGWEFNTEREYVLDPNEDGTIPLPANCLKCTTAKYLGGTRLFVRARKLYDNRKHTFIIGQAATVDMIIALPFEDMPDGVKRLVVATAANRWCRSKLPSGGVFTYTAEFVQDALMGALQDEVDELGDETLKDTSPHFAKWGRGRSIY